MPVQGVRFRSIEARRFQEAPSPQKVRVDHNSTFQSITQDNDHLRIEFAFTTSYGAMGMVKVEGTLRWVGADTIVASALSQWNDKRSLPQEVAQEVHSGILGACMPEAVMLARDLHLPPPLPIPQVRFQAPQGAKSPPEGPDAA